MKVQSSTLIANIIATLLMVFLFAPWVAAAIDITAWVFTGSQLTSIVYEGPRLAVVVFWPVLWLALISAFA